MTPRATVRRSASPRRLVACVLTLGCALFSGGSAAAQTSGVLQAGPGETSSDRPLVLTYSMAGRVRRPGGSGWIIGTLRNRGTSPHRAEIIAGAGDYGESRHGARFLATVEPGASVNVLLPAPYAGHGWPSLSLRSDGFSDSRQLDSKGDAHMGLLVVADGARGAELGRTLASVANNVLRQRFKSSAEEPDVVPPAWLPPLWTLLSGFDAILLDAAVDAGQQRVLVDVASAGARLLLTQHALAALPAGPLQERCAPLVGGRTSVASVGFGSVTVLAGADMPSTPALFGALDANFGQASGLPFEALLAPLALTTLIAVPPGFFAVVVVGYGVLLGSLLVREVRRRTPLRLMLLLPVTGCVLTVLVLGGSVVAEGTAVRGASRSLTLLDQQAHEMVVAGARTLYAGFWTSSSRPQPGTQVVPLDALSSEGGSLMLNAHEGGRLDPALLPARTPVTLALTSVGTSRERLLVRAEPDGGLRLVAEDSFRPIRGTTTVVLRLPDGRGFTADGDGLLQPAGDATLIAASSGLIARFVGARRLTRGALGESWNESEIALPNGVGFDPLSASHPLNAYVFDVATNGPPPGSYLARIERGVLLDDLGIEIEEEAEGVHLVLGRFAPGDVP